MEEANNSHLGTDKPSKVFELNIHDDIVAVIEYLRFSNVERVIFVLPDKPQIFQKLFNLRLLTHIAKILKKEVVIISQDVLVLRLAINLDLTIAPTVAALTDGQPAAAPPEREQVAPKPTSTHQAKDFKTSLPTYRVPERGVQPTRLKPPKYGRRFAVRLAIFMAILIGAVMAIYTLWPHSVTIEIETNITKLRRIDVQVTLSQNKDSLDINNNILPLIMKDIDETLEHEIEPSGRMDGVKAGGTVEIENCSETDEIVIDTQTILIRGGLEFIPQSSLLLPPNTTEDECGRGITITIEASAVGEEYNSQTGSYQILGLSEGTYNVRGNEIAAGAAGGVCVLESDIEFAQGILEQQRHDAEAKQRLLTSLRFEHDLIPLEETFQVAKGELVAPALCPLVSNNRIRQVLVYYLGGVEKETVAQIVEPALRDIAGDLMIVDNGLETADYRTYIRIGSQNKKPTVTQSADLDYYTIIDVHQATAGIDLDHDQVTEEILGVSVKQASARLRRLQGVKTVRVRATPFWLTTLPNNKDDIIININDEEGDE